MPRTKTPLLSKEEANREVKRLRKELESCRNQNLLGQALVETGTAKLDAMTRDRDLWKAGAEDANRVYGIAMQALEHAQERMRTASAPQTVTGSCGEAK